MSFWYDAIKKHEHEFFPERFDAEKLVWAIGQEDLPPATREMLADHLLTRAEFDVEKTIRTLEIRWWGDNPSDCTRAIVALQAAKDRR